MQGVAQPDVLDGNTQDLELLNPFSHQRRSFTYRCTDFRYCRGDVAGIYLYLSDAGDDSDDFHDDSSGTLDEEVKNLASTVGVMHIQAADRSGCALCASHVVQHKIDYYWPLNVRLAYG